MALHLLLILDHVQQSHPGGLRLPLSDVPHHDAHDLRHSDDSGAIPHHRPVARSEGGTAVRYPSHNDHPPLTHSRPHSKYTLTYPSHIISQKKVDSDALYKKIFPIALFFAFSLVFSNYAYVYLSVAYIQVLCALHTAVTRQGLM